MILAVLPFFFFAPLALVRRVFAVYDVQAYFFPYHVVPAKMLAEGHLPLWNPYVFSGIPLLGDGQTAMFYPPNWLFFLLPGAAALNYVVLLQFSIAGVGMYLFARTLGMWRLPAFVAGLAYMFCSFLTARVVHLSIMSGAALMPLILLCLDRLHASRVPDGSPLPLRARWLAATALAVAVQALAGHPQVPVYTALAAALYTLVRSVEQFFETGQSRRLVIGPLLLAIAYVLGGAVAAIQLVPWAELASLSVRAAGSDFQFIFHSSTRGAEWLLFLFPYLLGAHTASVFSVWPWGMHDAVRVWEHSGYVGMLPLALAAVGVGHFVQLTIGLRSPSGSPVETARDPLLRRRWYSLLFLILLLLTGLLLAAGWHTPLSQIVYRTPVLGSLRAVERGLVLASFALTVLGGFGLQSVLERPRARWLRVPAALVVAITVFVVWLAQRPELQAQLGIAPGDLANLTLQSPIAYVPLLLALCSGLLLAWWSWRPGGRLTHLAAIALVLIDMGLYTTSFTPTADGRIYRYPPEVVSVLHADGRLFRKATVLFDVGDLANRTAQETLALSWGMIHGIEDINGFNSLQTQRYTDFLFGSSANDVSYGFLTDVALFQPENPILSALNVRYVLVPKGLQMDLGAHLRPVFGNTHVSVYENTHVYPRAYFVDRVVSEPDPRRVLQQVTANGFDGRREALLETTEPPALPRPTVPATATAIRHSPNELRVATAAAEARMLVVSEMYFPGWRAYVDGVETPIYRANYLFRGVVVPAGRHVVTFVYRPFSVMIGAAVSVMALAVVGVLLAVARRDTLFHEAVVSTSI